MNERVQELALQAGFGENINRGIYLCAPNHVEKFAELIVRECALTAGLMEHEGRKNIGAQILDNFGIDN